MQLGSLSTVAARQQKNLCVVIMDNGAYQITGGQKTMTDQGADIVGIARASGAAAERLGGGRGSVRRACSDGGFAAKTARG